MKNALSNQPAGGAFRIKGILLLLVLLIGTTATWAQNATITLNARNTPLKEVLREIEKQSSYSFIYSSTTIDVTHPVSVECTNVSLNEALEKVCKSADITFTINNKQILLSPVNRQPSSQVKSTASSKNNEALDGKTIKGKVVDEKGETVIGANVWIKGTTLGIATDIDGNYSLKLSGNPQTLVASFIGYTPQELHLNTNTDTYNFTLKPEAQSLDEVIVTGYQTISKERATGSFAIVTPKDMEGKLQTNVLDRMEGMVAGLTQLPGKKPQIRGISTIEGTATPLYVVDGIPYEGSLDAINPGDIVNITVLKDATAASIYGARSANGVIVITTRSGSTGPTQVNYNGSVKFTPLPDRDYLNMMSSRELVDFQKEMFNYKHNPYQPTDRRATNEVYLLLYEHEAGNLTDAELEAKLDMYRNRERYDQIKDNFLRKASITHQHNLSFNGGSDIYKYSLSVNYQGDLPYEKEEETQRIGFNLKNQFNFFKWMRVDVGILGSNVTKDYDNGFTGYSYLNSGPSYRTLWNEDGTPTQWYGDKSQLELDRLNALGLQDETYYPVFEKDKKHYNYKSNYLNLNLAINLKLWEGLNLDLRYQNERTNTFTKQYDTKDANSIKKMINDATVIKNGVVTNHIPLGGQVRETDDENNSYTMRAQLNFNREFNDKHDVQVLIGTERRKVASHKNSVFKLGYDDFSLSYKTINELNLGQQIGGTESIWGTYQYTDNTSAFDDTDNRYVSFYGNASYTFDRRLTATGSIRIDQSNLFGTDPKYQYRPLWSVGAHYVLPTEDVKWLNRLVLRATYGINGNVAKKSGPYMIAKTNSYPNSYINETYSYIDTPPNPQLRWEKTNVINIGIDFSTLQNRLNGSVEFYNKYTTDLLGNQASDPTLGFNRLVVNYGEMRNRGIEISLQSENIVTGDFRWTSNFIFSYNKNMLTRIENSGTAASSYYSSAQNREGHAMGSLYSVRYAGLDKKGMPTAYKSDGTVISSINDLTKDDLVYSGTTIPPYSASLSNTFSYKGLDLSFMFVYYGGHVLRDVAAGYTFTYYPILNYASNRDRDCLNFWRAPGDENNPDMAPAFIYGTGNTGAGLWQAADKHVEKGDYIKLRDLTLGYTLPKNLLNRCHMRNIRINVQVQNLWYWAANKGNLDPEVWSGTTTTPSRGTHIPATYTIGLSANF